MQNVKLSDMYRIKLVGDVQVSKDGTKIAYVVARMDKKKNDYLSKIYLYDGKSKAFTSGPKDTMPRFAGDKIVYVRKGEKKSEIRVISLVGGESRKIAEVEKGVINMKIDGDYVYFLSPVVNKENDDVKRITSIPFYFNGKGFIYNASMQIFRVPLKGGKVEKLSNVDEKISSFDVKNGRIIYSASEDEREPFMENLYILKEGKGERISGRKASISSFRISPDGKKIAAFLSFHDKGFAEHKRLYMLSMEGGDYELACGDKFSFGKSLNSDTRFGGGSVMQWINENEILFIATDRGKQPVFIYSHGKCWKILNGNRSVESFAYAEGTLAFIAQEMNHPADVFIKRDRERRITNLNRFLKLPKGEHFTVKVSDGEEVEGWLLLPEGKGPHPAILEIHGGPKTSYGHAFMFEFYYFLSQGFAVIFTNPRGSSGYSEEFALKIRGDFGNRDYKDLMEALDFVLENYSIDKKKVFVTGGSYGGFMTNWIVGHTDRFRAAATQRSISNQLSFWGTSDIGPWFNKDYIGAGKDLWEGFENYWSMSPLKYAKNIKTPLLIIHSEEDYRCPISEAYQLFYALKMQGVDTKMVLFPHENHDLSRSGKPKHREIRLKEIVDWFKEHME
ncbi:S9 family peptidase [Candidatus Aciduliprofundum boonei]|uniref:Acyl-peptide hydrolase n=1 Tax=Aciduliprofundum boonei (strain DSM 19572 / T469) TaxID=439481 RepID=D3TCC1_ACIB4|nr:S9 family peptidase [Candidatus Aciduliprofundum boonei]ADD08206.1 peptidase S9 prolyl oligopeptidase active site domain protein [Aciduliprofundum boonei T469]